MVDKAKSPNFSEHSTPVLLKITIRKRLEMFHHDENYSQLTGGDSP